MRWLVNWLESIGKYCPEELVREAIVSSKKELASFAAGKKSRLCGRGPVKPFILNIYAGNDEQQIVTQAVDKYSTA